MDRLLYEELGKISGHIRDGKSDKGRAANVIRAYERVMEYVEIARKQGLLSLEEATDSLSGKGTERYLHDLIILVVDGTDPDDVEDIGWSVYFSRGFSSYDGLVYLIYLKGALLIQEGKSRYICDEMLKAMMPDEIRRMIPEPLEEEPFMTEEERQNRLIDDMIKGGDGNTLDENDFSIVNQTGLVIRGLSDSSLRKVLKDYLGNDLVCPLKVMPSDVRKKVMDNVSRHQRVWIAETIDNMGPIRYKDIQTDCEMLLDRIVYLSENSEIKCRDVEKIKLLRSISASLADYTQKQKEKYRDIAEIIDRIYHGED